MTTGILFSPWMTFENTTFSPWIIAEVFHLILLLSYFPHSVPSAPVKICKKTGRQFFAYRTPMASQLTQKANEHEMSKKSPRTLAHTHQSLPFLPLPPSIAGTLWVWKAPHPVLSQDFCGSPCLECSSPRYPHPSSWPALGPHLVSKASLTMLSKITSSPNSHVLLTPNTISQLSIYHLPNTQYS